MSLRLIVLGSVVALSAVAGASAVAQPAVVDLVEAINQLGDFDYDRRQAASRVVRRADAEAVAPLLREAAVEHPDSYVQYRALVLLYGVAPERARDAFAAALDSANDRVRTAAYDYFEHSSEPGIIPKLLAALETSESR